MNFAPKLLSKIIAREHERKSLLIHKSIRRIECHDLAIFNYFKLSRAPNENILLQQLENNFID